MPAGIDGGSSRSAGHCSSPLRRTTPPSASRVVRALRQRDETLKPEIQQVYDESFDGCLRPQEGLEAGQPRGHPCRQLHGRAGSCANSVSQACPRAALQGDDQERRAPATSERPGRPQFVAGAPNRLWVANLTYVTTFTGWVYVAFITDVFFEGDLRLADLDVAAQRLSDRRARDGDLSRRNAHDLTGLVHHSDRGVQYLGIRYTDASTRQRSSRRWAPRATPTTMPWPKASTASTSPSSSGAKVPGATSTRRVGDAHLHRLVQ